MSNLGYLPGAAKPTLPIIRAVIRGSMAEKVFMVAVAEG